MCSSFIVVVAVAFSVGTCRPTILIRIRSQENQFGFVLTAHGQHNAEVDGLREETAIFFSVDCGNLGKWKDDLMCLLATWQTKLQQLIENQNVIKGKIIFIFNVVDDGADV